MSPNQGLIGLKMSILQSILYTVNWVLWWQNKKRAHTYGNEKKK